jgi:hypothetical protein
LELKERMDASGEAVNWSRVAARAFEDKLAELVASKKEWTGEDVLQRLRASWLRSSDERYKQGQECGSRWAQQRAEAEELQRLERFLARLDRNPGSDRDDFFGGTAHGTAARLYFEMHPEEDGNRAAADAFWGDVLGKGSAAGDDAFLRGFAEGAEAVWDAVKRRL